jgi:hypothetical protein
MWETIEDKPNYEVNSDGEIRNKKTGRILKVSTRKDGYCQVMLGRKTIPLYVHRVVATAFIPNPDKLPQVDHINGNKSDNRLVNLRWLSVSGNNTSYGHHARNRGIKKPVTATNVITSEVKRFDSRKETAEHFKCNITKIKYGHIYKKGTKKNWHFKLVEDIV